MYLSARETMLIILVIALGTFLTRSLPFILFPDGRPIPKYVSYLGNTLPFAMIGLLVIYCIRNISFTGIFEGTATCIPTAIAILTIIVLHKWKESTLLSIVGGTIVYMILVQNVFVI